MDSETAWYYAACYALAAAAGLARLLRDRGADAIGFSCGVMFVSGFVGFGVAAFCGGDDVLNSDRVWVGFALAAFFGVAGPEQIKYISIINGGVLKRLGFDTEEDDDE